MKQFFLFLLLCGAVLASHAKIIDGGVYYSSEKKITFDFDHSDYQRDWYISPEKQPDILRLYCETKVELTFHLPSQNLTFTVSNRDTICVLFIINDADTALTLIVGVYNIPNSISEDEKLFHLSHLWSEARYNFVNIDQIHLDFDSLYKAYIPLVMNTVDDYEYYRLLQRFYASLHDGHTEVFMPEMLSVYEDYIPIGIDEFNKQLYITAVPKSHEFDSSFLASKIIAINGIPTQEYVNDSVLPYISASTEQSLWMQVPQAVGYGLRCIPLTLEIQKTNGEQTKITVIRNGEATRQENVERLSLRPPSTGSWDYVKLIWHEDSILQLVINSFYPDDYVISLLSKEENEILKAKRLVIDLRENGGGSTLVAHYLQSHLTKASFFLNFAWQSRINDGVKKANGNWITEYTDFYLEKAYRTENSDTIFIADSVRYWDMPTVVLFGEYTFSAAEDFLVNLYETSDRPLFVGQESGGSTGSPLVIEDLPLDGYARLCTRRILFPYSQKPFVGKGIEPDVKTTMSFNDFVTGNDKSLQKAIDILRKY